VAFRQRVLDGYRLPRLFSLCRNLVA